MCVCIVRPSPHYKVSTHTCIKIFFKSAWKTGNSLSRKTMSILPSLNRPRNEKNLNTLSELGLNIRILNKLFPLQAEYHDFSPSQKSENSHNNTGVKNLYLKLFDQRTKARILELNKADQKLYNYAVGRLETTI